MDMNKKIILNLMLQISYSAIHGGKWPGQRETSGVAPLQPGGDPRGVRGSPQRPGHQGHDPRTAARRQQPTEIITFDNG